MTIRKSIARFARQLRRDQGGVGIVEFAICLPVLLILVMGGLEVANLALTQQRIAQIASQVSQNAARGTQQIDEADVNEVFTAATLTADGTPILTKGRVILSSVRLNDKANGQWIDWQRCDGDDTTVISAYGAQNKGKSDTSLQQVGPAPGLRAVAGVNIMLVEIQTKYQPLIGNTFSIVKANSVLSATAAQVVRDRTTMGIKNDGNLTASQISSC